ncbi:hypothetical protein BH23GEM7_BH23GEM7_41260 [soil metagenome]|jgi:hypothetical protein
MGSPSPQPSACFGEHLGGGDRLDLAGVVCLQPAADLFLPGALDLLGIFGLFFIEARQQVLRKPGSPVEGEIQGSGLELLQRYAHGSALQHGFTPKLIAEPACAPEGTFNLLG